MNDVKVCTKCGFECPLEQVGDFFYKGEAYKGGFQSNCKSCFSAHSRAWYEANREKRSARQALWYAANYDRHAANGAAWKKKHPLYNTWAQMMQRCYNPNTEYYCYYGARGITVCERWHSFENFEADMSPRPEGKTLDRINNDLGYSPENCEWRTPKEQASNRRPRAKAA